MSAEIVVPAAIGTLATTTGISSPLGLLLLPGRPWYLRPRAEDGVGPRGPSEWANVCIVLPARNEAALLPQTVPSLLAQDYPGRFRVVVVDGPAAAPVTPVGSTLAPDWNATDRVLTVAVPQAEIVRVQLSSGLDSGDRHRLRRLADRREVDGRETCHRTVVVAHDRHVAGNVDPRAPKRIECTQRRAVVEADQAGDRPWPSQHSGPNEILDGTLAGLLGGTPGHDSPSMVSIVMSMCPRPPMHNSASTRPAPRPPGVSMPASITRAPDARR